MLVSPVVLKSLLLTSCCTPPAASVQTGRTCRGTHRDSLRASHSCHPRRSDLSTDTQRLITTSEPRKMQTLCYSIHIVNSGCFDFYSLTYFSKYLYSRLHFYTFHYISPHYDALFPLSVRHKAFKVADRHKLMQNSIMLKVN